MWRDWLLRFAQLVLSVAGAAILACALAAFGAPASAHGFAGYAVSLGDTLLRMLHADLGTSAVSHQPVWNDAAGALASTLWLAGNGAVLAFAFGIPLGIVFSFSGPLRVGAPLLQILAAVPIFCAAMILTWLDRSYSGGAFTNLLPVVVTGVAGASCVQLVLRRAAAFALSEPYRKGLRMMGLGAFEIDLHYVLPQIVAGIAEHLGLIVLTVLSAAAIVEPVFNIGGLAFLFFASVTARDWAVAAFVLFCFASVKLFADFLGLAIARLLVVKP